MMNDISAAFVVCWFGKLPDYLPIWLKSCEKNPEYTFLLLCDHAPSCQLPSNVKHISFTKEDFMERARKIVAKPSLEKAYRVCDFRPMFGLMLENELRGFDFWGYCDMDLVFGRISDFVSQDTLSKVDGVFNGGHFSLYRNCEKMNNLFRQPGAIFDYRTVAQKNAIYAFDETTGIQRIARQNGVNAQFGIPYVEADARFRQLRCRTLMDNPPHQAFYWENGELYRVKAENGQVFYQKMAYIHLQKRKIAILDDECIRADRFFITPEGFAVKENPGAPAEAEIEAHNPYLGEEKMSQELSRYKKQKLLALCKRGPYGVYVRIRQQQAGINAGDGAVKEEVWEKF